MSGMQGVLSIGDFARATQVSAKALRHYHHVGLLEPARTDPETGYRYYALDQIATARLIRRFRELDMPLEEIRTVVTTAEVALREEMISRHLRRLEGTLQRTQEAVVALRGILDGDGGDEEVTAGRIGPVTAMAITAHVSAALLPAWFRGAHAELGATAEALGVPVTGPAGSIVPTEVFTHEEGEITVFLPVADHTGTVGRVRGITVPGGDFAVLTHHGSHADVDRSYARLGDHVARAAFGLDEPIREYYRVGPPTPSEQWITEICWPVLAVTT
jgi:DNA-binding transcriptional MerR regulator/effector-binding domain-containing protein